MENQILKINTGVPSPFKMAIFDILKIVQEHDPSLKTPCVSFEFIDPKVNPIWLASTMFSTMFKNGGVGLSANQVGHPWRVFVMGIDDNNKQVFFNPTIVSRSDDNEDAVEGCLSFPHLYLSVNRPKSVTIRYQHVNGEFREETYTGTTARIICHEMDHLDGITMADKVSRMSLYIARNKQKLSKKIESRRGHKNVRK